MDGIIIGGLFLSTMLFCFLYYKERDVSKAFEETLEDAKIIESYIEEFKKAVDAINASRPKVDPPDPPDKAPPGTKLN